MADTTDPAAEIAGKLRERIEQLRARIASDSADLARHEAALSALTDAALTPARVTGNTTGKMLSVARIKRSKSATDNDPCAVAANARGFTMADLARTLDITPQYLSMLRHGHRAISASLAARIEELTGFAASKKNWPRIKQ